MALEDFDEANDELELDIEQLDLDAQEASEAESAQDEDLFAFPESGRGDAEVAPQVQAPLPEPTGAGVHGAGQPGSPGHDPELDEDVFDFADLFAGTGLAQAPAPEGEGFEAPSGAVDMATPASEPEPAVQPEAQPTPTVTVTPVAPVNVDQPPTPAAPRTVADLARDKVVMTLGAAFLVMNAALILLAWQANSSLHSTIADVTRTIADGVSQAAPPVQAAPRAEYAPVETTGSTTPSPEPRPLQASTLAGDTVQLARRLMNEGRYLDARRQLNHMLANQDVLTSIDREVVAEAEFLIAETYQLQGSALLQEGSR